MTTNELSSLIKQTLKEDNPNAILFDGLDDALIGYTWNTSGDKPVALYNFDVCIAIVVEKGKAWEAAVDHVSTNLAGAWLGPNTPTFCWSPVDRN